MTTPQIKFKLNLIYLIFYILILTLANANPPKESKSDHYSFTQKFTTKLEAYNAISEIQPKQFFTTYIALPDRFSFININTGSEFNITDFIKTENKEKLSFYKEWNTSREYFKNKSGFHLNNKLYEGPSCVYSLNRCKDATKFGITSDLANLNKAIFKRISVQINPRLTYEVILVGSRLECAAIEASLIDNSNLEKNLTKKKYNGTMKNNYTFYMEKTYNNILKTQTAKLTVINTALSNDMFAENMLTFSKKYYNTKISSNNVAVKEIKNNHSKRHAHNKGDLNVNKRSISIITSGGKNWLKYTVSHCTIM